MSNLFDLAADVGSSEDEDYDEENDEPRTRTRKTNGDGNVDDSSEEDDDDDDAEEEAAIREGFIVDEDDDNDDEARDARRREKRKRRREQREEEEDVLDEEDLDLIGEANPELERKKAESAPKFKRLKQGHRRESGDIGDRGGDIFSDEEDDLLDGVDTYRGARAANPYDEFADFIEEDLPDDVAREREDEREVMRPGRKLVGSFANLDLSGVDEGALEDYRAAFGDGDEYGWALEFEQEQDIDQEEKDKELELKDVFEPSVLAEKLLTDADNEIRYKDVPERLQLARKSFKQRERTQEETLELHREEAMWISSILAQEKRIESSRLDAFRTTVTKVLEFLNQEDMEIPFIKHYRRDYLIQKVRVVGDNGQSTSREERMLNDDELWDVFDADIKFRGLVERREAVQQAYDSLRMNLQVTDEVMDDLLSKANDTNVIQDLQEYLNFQFSAELKDAIVFAAAETNGTNGTHKKARVANSHWERIRASRVYTLVRNLSIGADALARDLKHGVKRSFADDPTETPVDMADSLLDPPMFSTGEQVLRSAKAMAVEEYTHSPRLRKFVRDLMFQDGHFDCIRTEKGARQIGEDHRYYEFKYLRNQPLRRAGQDSEMFLRMLKAESEGLVNVKIFVQDIKMVQKRLRSFVVSDNLSEVADAWNKLRQQAIDEALDVLLKIIAKGVKDTLRSACEDKLAKACRETFRKKLDSAPYKPFGCASGTVPHVLAMTNGTGDRREGIYWCMVKAEQETKIVDQGKMAGLRPIPREKSTSIPADPDVEKLVDVIRKWKPDVIAISGFSTEAKRLANDVEKIIEWGMYAYDLTEDAPRPLVVQKDDSNEVRNTPVVIANDECARLYWTSERAKKDNPSTNDLTRYCFGLARALQDPTAEYIALGQNNLSSIVFHPDQDLVPHDKLLRYLEMAMVEIVNLKGIDLNEAFNDPDYLGQQLQYIAGMGPRKVKHLIKALQVNDGFDSRSDLVGDPEANIMQSMRAKVFQNAAGFLYIDSDNVDGDEERLDSTRIHPEDYDLARKIVADALGMDEEDIAAEIAEHGPGGVVRRLYKEEKAQEVDELELDHYADALLKDFNQHKRATLELIRSELQEPHEELRLRWEEITPEDQFTMLTGETTETLQAGMNVPVKIRRFLPDEILASLDCGLEGHISQGEWPDGMGAERGGPEPRNVFQLGQVLQAKLMFIDRKRWPPTVNLSIRERELKAPFRRFFDHAQDEWDSTLEATDRRAAQKAKEDVSGRAQRVIKHPLFRPFNSTQAEEFLGSQALGSVVIRPSSRGFDHLVVTWKVADNVYQHLDVLEMKKENEFALGRVLRIGTANYSDLDELIVNHVNAMARKVDEMMHDERFQSLSKKEADEWLTTYTEANPRRAMYAFCINPKFPGYFFLIFKEGAQGTLRSWNVKVVPGAFELNKTPYPDMRSLRNGLKMQLDSERPGVGRR